MCVCVCEREREREREMRVKRLKEGSGRQNRQPGGHRERGYGQIQSNRQT